MKKALNIFERHEMKYLVTDWQRRILEREMERQMVPDPHGESTICNLYFDTPDFRLIRRSLERPVYKEKLRLRSYGPVGPGDSVFVELKKKYDGIVYKRRISLPEEQAMDFLCREGMLPQGSQIGREIAYFLSFYPSLAPVMHISYDRTAYFSKADPDLRVTFDQNILWRSTELSLGAKPGGSALLAPAQSLMEIKTASAIPLWLVHLLSQNRIYKTSFSKYGNAYCNSLQKNEIGGIHCA